VRLYSRAHQREKLSELKERLSSTWIATGCFLSRQHLHRDQMFFIKAARGSPVAFFIEASTWTAASSGLLRNMDRRRLFCRGTQIASGYALKSVQTHQANRRTVMADRSSTAGIHLIVEQSLLAKNAGSPLCPYALT
jgi:hypothetical protein